MRPVTSTLSTTPTMTWSTRYLIAKAASTNETNMPATIADARPMSGCPVREATTADTNAPASSWPSIATLTTPTRSESTPPSAPKMSGTDRATVPTRRPGTGIVWPADAQVRNATRNRIANTTVNQSGTFADRRTSTADTTVSAARTTVTATPVAAVGSTSGASWMRSVPVERPNVLDPSRPSSTNRTRAITVKTPKATGAFQLVATARSSAAAAGSCGAGDADCVGVVAVMRRSPPSGSGWCDAPGPARAGGRPPARAGAPR